jgi:hypothetical protein
MDALLIFLLVAIPLNIAYLVGHWKGSRDEADRWKLLGKRK